MPSFYALDVKRALTGRIPSHEDLQHDAYDRGAATLGWPAPAEPMRAIDALEHDLAILRPLFDERDRAKVAGRARYLLELNPVPGPFGARALGQISQAVVRCRRPRQGRPTPSRSRWPRSVSALDRTRCRRSSTMRRVRTGSCCRRSTASRRARTPSRCSGWIRSTKGSLFHRVQAEFLRTLRDGNRLPIRPDTLDAALQTLGDTLAHVAEDERARLAPAIPRVWDDEIAIDAPRPGALDCR